MLQNDLNRFSTLEHVVWHVLDTVLLTATHQKRHSFRLPGSLPCGSETKESLDVPLSHLRLSPREVTAPLPPSSIGAYHEHFTEWRGKYIHIDCVAQATALWLNKHIVSQPAPLAKGDSPGARGVNAEWRPVPIGT